MANQPDIVQPRVRRSIGGNTPAALAEQSTRVLIRVPRLSGSVIQTQTTQGQLTQPHSIRPQPIQPQAIQPQSVQPPRALAKPLSADLAPAPATGQRSHYSTTTEQLQGSAPRPAAPASAPSVSRSAARIDAAHTAGSGPHMAAPDWLNDRAGKTNSVAQTRLLLVVGAVAGFALRADVAFARKPRANEPKQRLAHRSAVAGLDRQASLGGQRTRHGCGRIQRSGADSAGAGFAKQRRSGDLQGIDDFHMAVESQGCGELAGDDWTKRRSHLGK